MCSLYSCRWENVKRTKSDWIWLGIFQIYMLIRNAKKIRINQRYEKNQQRQKHIKKIMCKYLSTNWVGWKKTNKHTHNVFYGKHGKNCVKTKSCIVWSVCFSRRNIEYKWLSKSNVLIKIGFNKFWVVCRTIEESHLNSNETVPILTPTSTMSKSTFNICYRIQFHKCKCK